MIKLQRFLEWEILWQEVPHGFRPPNGHPAKLSLYATTTNLWYCSDDLASCSQYSIEEHYLKERLSEEPCKGGRTSDQCLSHFLGQSRILLRLPGIGNDDLTFRGRIAAGGGVFWVAAPTIPPRTEIIKSYRNERNPQLASLTLQLKTELQHATDPYNAVTIPCFRAHDPYVEIFGERLKGNSTVFSMFWDPDLEEWKEASVTLQDRDKEVFEDLRRIVTSVACEVIRFN